MWGSGSLATLPRRVPRGESSCSGVSRSMMAGGEADVLMLQDQARRLPRCPQVTPCSWAQVNHPGEEDPGGPASFLPCMLYIFSGLLCWRWARGPSLFHFACMLPIRAGPAPGCVPALPAGGGGAGKGPWVGPGHSRVLFSEARFKSRCCLSSLNSRVKCLYLLESCSCFGEGNGVMIGWL